MTADNHDPLPFLDGAYADAFEAIEDKGADTLERQALMRWRAEIVAAREALKGIRSAKKRQEVIEDFLARPGDALDRRIREAALREYQERPQGRGRPPKGLAPQTIGTRRARHTQRVEDEREAILFLLREALDLVPEGDAKALMERSTTAIRGILRAEKGHLFKRWLPEHALEHLTTKVK
ncbi:MAG: hypothetical protein FD176_161 [Rhodospirillaceae bacterium]|nr:MAG: hypothetical protein FD176_161 [Rhodospirillaceae bacterium]TNC98679.1 MAG: hypothetical protein FD119_150 [Stygiobacter sp.]